MTAALQLSPIHEMISKQAKVYPCVFHRPTYVTACQLVVSKQISFVSKWSFLTTDWETRGFRGRLMQVFFHRAQVRFHLLSSIRQER